MSVADRLLTRAAQGLLIALVGCGHPEPAEQLPNIVFIMADDMGYGDVGVYNPDSRIPTPNMDRLASEGIRFTDAHSADSVCTPTRYALLTGRYCWRTPLKRTVLFNYEPPLIERGRMTIASLLREHGYLTAMIGKWHLGLGFTTKPGKTVDFDRPMPWPSGPLPDPEVGASIDFSATIFGGPNDLGFDYAYYNAGCSTDQEPFCFIKNKAFLGMENASYRNPTGSWRSGMAAPDWVNETVDVRHTEEAVGFIERSSEREPFFLYLALSAPHSPHMVPDFAAGKSEAGIRGDMVWLVDWSVGKVAEALEAKGLADNTLVVLTSDNGPLAGSRETQGPENRDLFTYGHKSAGDLRGFKGRIYEGGHRVPFIARWPGKIEPGLTSDERVSLVDMLATSAAIVGAELPDDAGEDSYNVLPALLGVTTDRGPMVHHSGGGAFSLRKGDWKIVFGKGENRVEPSDGEGYLFDLAADPYETTDVWQDHPQVVAELTKLMADYKTEGRSAPAR